MKATVWAESSIFYICSLYTPRQSADMSQLGVSPFSPFLTYFLSFHCSRFSFYINYLWSLMFNFILISLLNFILFVWLWSTKDIKWMCLHSPYCKKPLYSWNKWLLWILIDFDHLHKWFISLSLVEIYTLMFILKYGIARWKTWLNFVQEIMYLIW